MCGIAGWLGPVPSRPDTVSSVALALAHRGPDATGDRVFPHATLIHTRLKILDLTDAAHQPLESSDSTICVVFNGEIYNHHQLREELESRGHLFHGRSDTEVIPPLYQEYGSDFAKKLRGMFAIAVYDQRRQLLLLARDRFGIKPLYYSIGRNHIAFASELNALRLVPGIDIRPDRQAIHDFLSLLFVPAPQTFFRGIRSLEPGQLVEARLQRDMLACSTRQYHHWTIAPDVSLGLPEAAARASDLIDQAVSRQLESDVPLGTLLSGGIDSSLVASAARPVFQHQLRTFNVTFADPAYDETSTAVAVARNLGTRHETLDFQSGAGGWDHITRLLKAYGQPFADTSLFAVHAVCELTRRRVTVVLSGDGGDEGFGGYRFFGRLLPFALVQRLPRAVQRDTLRLAGLGASTARRFGVGPANLLARLDNAAHATDPVGAVESLLSWIRPSEVSRLWRGGDVDPVRRLYERRWEHSLPNDAGRLERLSALTTEIGVRLRLANDFLTKVDIASMQTSLEVRVPLLDEDLFNFGLTLPHRLKHRRGTGKPVLRAVAAERLPRSVVTRPKHGFGVPMDTWVDAAFKRRFREELLRPTSNLDTFLDPASYRPLIRSFCDGVPHAGLTREGLYQRAFMLLSLDLALAQ